MIELVEIYVFFLPPNHFFLA